MKQKKPFIFAVPLIFFLSCAKPGFENADISPAFGNYTTVCHRTFYVDTPYSHLVDTSYTQHINVYLCNEEQKSIWFESTDTNTMYPVLGKLYLDTYYENIDSLIFWTGSHYMYGQTKFKNGNLWRHWHHMSDATQTANWVGLKDE